MGKFDLANTIPEEPKSMASYEAKDKFNGLFICNFEYEPLTNKQKYNVGIRFDETLNKKLSKQKTKTVAIFSLLCLGRDIEVTKFD